METGVEDVSQSPVIHRPDDDELIARLEDKRKEYASRIGDEFTHPEQGIITGLAAGSVQPLDAYIKLKLLNEVLENGSVATWDFTSQIFEDSILASLGEIYAREILDRAANACGVINAYCNNDQSQLVSGTGLQ